MNYNENVDYYDILGIPKDASLENIQKAKNRLYWEERVPYFMWNKIDEAYKVLSDSERRKEYDKFLEEKVQTSDLINDQEVIDSNLENEIKSEELSDNNVSTDDKFVDDEQPKKTDDNIYSHSRNIDVPNAEEKDDEKQLPYQEEENKLKKEESKKDETAISNKDKSPIIEFIPVENQNKQYPKIKTFGVGATSGIFTAGALSLVVSSGVAPIVLGVVVSYGVAKLYKKTSLKEQTKSLELSKLSTEELQEVENYNKTLEQQINKLLSEPHNNYKLEINRLKYENQIKLQEALLNIKISNSNSNKKGSKFKYKMDLVATKMHLETAKNNLEKINEKIQNYEGESKLAKINENLIKANNDLQTAIKENELRPNEIKRLNSKKLRIFNRRDKKALKTKNRVIKQMEIYDKILFAKDFVVSAPYAFKNINQVDDFIESGIAKSR